MEPPPLPARGTPLEPRQSPSKRPRGTTTTAPEPSLPPRRRPTRRARDLLSKRRNHLCLRSHIPYTAGMMLGRFVRFYPFYRIKACQGL